MLRFILLTLIAYLLFRWVKKLLRASVPRPAFERDEKVSGRFNSRQASATSPMIRCEACGMFVTRSSAFLASNGNFCSKKCFEDSLRKA